MPDVNYWATGTTGAVAIIVALIGLWSARQGWRVRADIAKHDVAAKGIDYLLGGYTELVQEATARYTTTRAELIEARTEISSLRVDLDKTERHLRQCERDNEEARRASAAAARRITSLEMDLAAQTAKITDLLARIAQLEIAPLRP